MKFSTWGLTYSDACSLIDELNAGGIEANITAGGVAMYPDESRIPKMHLICKSWNTTASVGNTLHQAQVLNPKTANAYINRLAKDIHDVDLGLPG